MKTVPASCSSVCSRNGEDSSLFVHHPVYWSFGFCLQRYNFFCICSHLSIQFSFFSLKQIDLLHNSIVRKKMYTKLLDVFIEFSFSSFMSISCSYNYNWVFIAKDMRMACRLWKLFPDNIHEFRQQKKILMEEEWSISTGMQDQPRIWLCKTIFTKESWRETTIRITFTSTSESTELTKTKIKNFYSGLKVSGTPARYFIHVGGHWWGSHFFSVHFSTWHVSNNILLLADARVRSFILLHKKSF